MNIVRPGIITLTQSWESDPFHQGHLRGSHGQIFDCPARDWVAWIPQGNFQVHTRILSKEILSLYLFFKIMIMTPIIPTQILIMIEKVAGVEPHPQSRLHHLPSTGCCWGGGGWGAEWDVEALILIEIKIYRSCSPGGLFVRFVPAGALTQVYKAWESDDQWPMLRHTG